MLDDLSTRPYFIRAIHQWCVDRGHTPYILAHWRAEQYPEIPPKLANKEGIVFNLSSPSVRGLVIDAEGVFFTGRFWGKIVEVRIPLADIIAIYAKEIQKGFSFPPSKEVQKEVPGLKVEEKTEQKQELKVELKVAQDLKVEGKVAPELKVKKKPGRGKKEAQTAASAAAAATPVTEKKRKIPNLRVI